MATNEDAARREPPTAAALWRPEHQRTRPLVRRQRNPTNKRPVAFPTLSESPRSIDSAIGRVHHATMVRIQPSILPIHFPPRLSSSLCGTSETDSSLGSDHQNKDATHTSLHFHRARDADLSEQFCRDGGRLPADDIYVPAAHQPVNPEDEDDVVPDQHAAFGIQKATMAKREPAWRDFGLGELMGKGPAAGVWKGVAGRGAGVVVKKTALPR
ncbi:unnamed protein product [Discula destructiva]